MTSSSVSAAFPPSCSASCSTRPTTASPWDGPEPAQVVLRGTCGRRTRRRSPRNRDGRADRAERGGLRIEVAAPGGRRAGLVTWQQVDDLLRPGATPARRQIVTRAWQAGISFTSADSSFRAVGEGRLAAAARDELTAIAVTVVGTILEAVRPAGSTGFPQPADEAAMTGRIAELAASLPAEQPRPRTPAAEVNPGDVIGHYSYRFHPFLVTEPPRQAGDAVEITGRLTEPEPGEPAGPFTLTVPRGGPAGSDGHRDPVPGALAPAAVPRPPDHGRRR